MRTLGLAVIAASSLAMTGCGSTTGSTPLSQLRIIDASPDSGGLDIYASGNALAYNLGFGTITSYVAITPGTYTVQVKPAGTATTVLSTKTTLPASKQFTLLVGNVNASLEGLVLADQSGPAPSGQIALRFLNEASKIGALDIYLCRVPPRSSQRARLLRASSSIRTRATSMFPWGRTRSTFCQRGPSSQRIRCLRTPAPA